MSVRNASKEVAGHIADISKRASQLLNRVASLMEKTVKTKHAKRSNVLMDLNVVKQDLQGVVASMKTVSARLTGERLGRRFAAEIGEVADEAFDILEDAEDAIEQAQKIINPEKSAKDEEPGEEEAEGNTEDEEYGEEGGDNLEEGMEEDFMGDVPMKKSPKVDEDKVVNTVASWKRGLNRIAETLRTKGTAIPPTGAKDTGDKKAEDGDPAEIELKHWHEGNEEGQGDINKDKVLTNPASEPRLIDKGNPADHKPNVNASLVRNKSMEKTAWIVRKGSKPFYIVSFADAVAKGGDGEAAMTAENLLHFSSASYRQELVDTIRKEGLKSVIATIGGKVIKAENAEDPEYGTSGHEGIDPDGETIGEKGYYADAYGDSNYAQQLTSSTPTTNAKLAAENAALKQQLASVTEAKRKQVKATRAVELARLEASRGLIPFTREALKVRASEIFGFADQAYDQVYKTVEKLPMKHEAALYAREIKAADEAPNLMEDADSGVVGNPLMGVRDPKAKADTEDMPGDVMGDAKIAGQYNDARRAVAELTGDQRASVRNAVHSGVVPQMTKSASENQSGGVDLSERWNTTENRLRRKGLDPSQFRGANYRQ